MTFNPVAALNVLECKNMIAKDKPKAIDLGSQTASIDSIFIKNLIFFRPKFTYLILLFLDQFQTPSH